MKYTEEQIKDLLYVAEYGCLSKKCRECSWRKDIPGEMYGCKLVGPPSSKRMKECAKERIQELIEGKHESTI